MRTYSFYIDVLQVRSSEPLMENVDVVRYFTSLGICRLCIACVIRSSCHFLQRFVGFLFGAEETLSWCRLYMSLSQCTAHIYTNLSRNIWALSKSFIVSGQKSNHISAKACLWKRKRTFRKPRSREICAWLCLLLKRFIPGFKKTKTHQQTNDCIFGLGTQKRTFCLTLLVGDESRRLLHFLWRASDEQELQKCSAHTRREDSLRLWGSTGFEPTHGGSNSLSVSPARQLAGFSRNVEVQLCWGPVQSGESLLSAWGVYFSRNVPCCEESMGGCLQSSALCPFPPQL